MEKQIDQLIEKHKDGDYAKYTLLCSVSDFKKLQRLMSQKYKIKDYPGNNSMWTHNGTVENPTRIGTVRFNNFEINVTCKTKYEEDFVLHESSNISTKFKNSRK